jgi:ParB-like nuclease domain
MATRKEPIRPLPKADYVEIEKLDFDPTNPRIVERLGESPTRSQISELILGESAGMSARELIPSFMINGYLPYEPLIVRPEKRGRHLVLEGNRRLAALLAMRDSKDPEERAAFVRHRLDSVPCVIFRGDEEQELAYLALRHVSKTKDWTAAAKAAFIERMLKSGADLEGAAQRANVTKNALRQMLLVRRLFERAESLGLEMPSQSPRSALLRGSWDGSDGDVTFWHLGDAVRRTRTRQYLNLVENEDPLEQPSLDEGRFEKLVGWIYGNSKTGQTRLIASIRDVPNLDKCLGHPKSVEALEAGASISDALEEAEAAGAKVTAHLERAKSSVQRATGGLSDVTPGALSDVNNARDALGRAIKAFDTSLGAIDKPHKKNRS